jgi:hypothetical protein
VNGNDCHYERRLASSEPGRSTVVRTIRGESFEIWAEDNKNTVFFKGALRLSGMEDYAPVLEMLQERLTTLHQPIVLDLRELDFLYSSGITMLSRFVIEARDRTGIDLYFFASSSIAWHARSLKNLQRLMPNLTIQLT